MAFHSLSSKTSLPPGATKAFRVTGETTASRGRKAIFTESTLFTTQIMFVAASMQAAVAAIPLPTSTSGTTHSTTFIRRRSVAALVTVILVRLSSEFIRNLYICGLEEVQTQAMEWLKDLQARRVVRQRG